VLYLGRIERNKGGETLLQYFERYLERGGAPVQLVLAGPANMPLPEHPLVKRLGVVDDAVRDALLAEASLLVIPSPFESLSMVLLEAWNRGLPALVNGHCKVLKGQVLRADGGLYYHHANEFAAGLTYLLDHPDVARRLGRQGLAYVEREYRWPTVMGKVERFLRESLARRVTVPTTA
jgi:glycosyltransferase involved in cell wall biosynthesis